jgi:ribosomal protein L9
MSAFAPTALPQVRNFLVPRTAATDAGRQPMAPAREREARRHEALRREAERADRQRAQAERARDNAAARHPLALR